MFELSPEVLATLGGSGTIALAIWRAATAVAKAATKATEYIDQLGETLEAEQKHREAEAEHWSKTEAFQQLSLKEHSGELLQ